ncbi:uncharacterized protein E0L32_011124 [Thyridium curvatum]|uniref:NADH-ubiquinone oxidoreductase 29.9 kDa subunit n=1 Tax=Thyridium curvatum TaxID=1093900 RepID=A0A507AQ51_9PEZI|nr:uncharacterized protein E0L32_011124 [Thyridium curvatum]TPX06979.1 hypothetical protein E0L32_011124 [Thyridium curvatum]
MRRTLRLLASVKPARYLEPGTQTGLAGVYTHSSPRSALLYLYTHTLEKLKAFPEHSVYRQSVEALTKHRLAIVEASKPAGYDEWAERARKLIAENPGQFNVSASGRIDGAQAHRITIGGKEFLVRHIPPEKDQRYQEWDGEIDEGPELEGARTEEERKDQVLLATRKPLEEVKQIKWEDEPQLTADQISEIENKIGAGLIEEVIEVAEGEVGLIDKMLQAKVWESLEEKPAEGQWKYFERK